jgi:hypothetical protein
MTMLITVGLTAVLTLTHGMPASGIEETRALAVQFADGRRVVAPLSTTGRVNFTAAFPRIDGINTSRDGLPLVALQYEEALEAGGVAVTVALLYGTPQQRRVPIETVHVTSPAPVRVESLEAFGVKPIALSLVSLPPVQLVVPAVTSASSNLEIAMETVTDPVPGYVATIVNHGSRDVMMMSFSGYRGSEVAMSGRPRGTGRTALIPAGGTYVLNLRGSAGGQRGATEWQQIDRLEITSVLWSDDFVEGDGTPAADEHAINAGTALQLDRLIAVLRAGARDPAAHPLAELREQVASLAVSVTAEQAAAVGEAIPGTVRLPPAKVSSMMARGMASARNAVLNDIDEVLKSSPTPAPQEYAGWLTRVVDKYSAWRARLR